MATVSFRGFTSKLAPVLVLTAILLILLAVPTKAFDLSAFQQFTATNRLSHENAELVYPGVVVDSADDMVTGGWMDESWLRDLQTISEPDAVDSTSPYKVTDRILAGFTPSSVFMSSSSTTGDMYGGKWVVTLFALVFIGLLVLFTKYVLTRNGAFELEREVMERTSALEKSSEQYRSLVENAMVGIFRVNADGLIETVNPALVKILHCVSSEKLLGRSLRDDVFIEPDQWDRIRNLQNEQGWVTGFELKWNRCDGEIATVRLSGRWVVPDGGEPVCELIAEDITVLAHARLAELETERLRGVQKLAIAVAHEFNNPLSILLGTYQLYLEPNLDNFDHDVRDRLGKMPESVSRMRDLVSRLLRITKLRDNEYLHGASYLNLDQSAGDEEDINPVDEAEELIGGSGRTFASFP